jgi:hypothetical protein
MPSHTLHVVQSFEERDGGIVPVEPKACPSAGSARALAARLAQTHVGVIAWSRTGDLELGDRGPPVASFGLASSLQAAGWSSAIRRCPCGGLPSTGPEGRLAALRFIMPMSGYQCRRDWQ